MFANFFKKTEVKCQRRLNRINSVNRNKISKTVKLKGTVIKCLSNAVFIVQLDNGLKVLSHISGKMRKNIIKVLLNDVRFGPSKFIT